MFESRTTGIGLGLFGVYFLGYLGFVLLNAFSPETMELRPIAGINLAILYGFALIAAAFVLAICYGWFCSQVKSVPAAGSKDKKERSE